MVGGQHSDVVRAFALTLNFYSPKAYRYVREKFEKLPHPSTIRSWYSNTNCDPGITGDAIDVLKNKCKNSDGKTIYASLTMDEMAIRQQIEWDHSTKKYIGFIDYGTNFNSSTALPIAKEALVYVLTGINERWKIPVAYFFIKGMTTTEKARVTKRVLKSVVETGIHVLGLTFDGLSSNLKMCELLGVDLWKDLAFFSYPHKDKKTFIVMDPSHMLKLLRNIWATRGTIYDEDGNPIKWDLMKNLHTLQSNGYFHLANKLGTKHINWHQGKMNVKLAAQTMSESCAVAIEHLSTMNHPGFINCDATVKFLRIVNIIFDILNSRSLFSYGYKRPLMSNTAENILRFSNMAIKYLLNLKFEPDAQYIIESMSKTGPLGMIVNLRNLKHIYKEFIETGYLKYLLYYKLSQDHLEVFFSSIRSMGGHNNNPNCKQFMAAYKKLMHHNEIKSSGEANCIQLDTINILTVSSRKKIREPSVSESITETPTENEADNPEIPENHEIPLDIIDPVCYNVCLYICGWVETRIMKTLGCKKCLDLLNECRFVESSFIQRKSEGFLRYPRVDTYTIGTECESVLNLLRIQNKLSSHNVYNIIRTRIFRNLNIDHIFENFDEHVRELEVLENHKYYLISLIVELYCKVKLYHFGKRMTTSQHSSFIRKKLTKTVIFSGQ